MPSTEILGVLKGSRLTSLKFGGYNRHPKSFGARSTEVVLQFRVL